MIPASPVFDHRPLAPRRRWRGKLLVAGILGLLAGTFFAAVGAGFLPAAVAGIAVFAIWLASSRRRRPPPAQPGYPAAPHAAPRPRPRPRPVQAAAGAPGQTALRRQVTALNKTLGGFGHQMTWNRGGGQTGVTVTGTCQRCGGQVTARRTGEASDVTVSFPGQVLLMPGQDRALRWCGGSQ